MDSRLRGNDGVIGEGLTLATVDRARREDKFSPDDFEEVEGKLGDNEDKTTNRLFPARSRREKPIRSGSAAIAALAGIAASNQVIACL